MKKFLVMFVLLIVSPGFIKAQENILNQPLFDKEVKRSMKTPGFWISHHKKPDALIMNPEAIEHFNSRLRLGKKLTKDIFTLIQDFKTESLLETLEKDLRDVTDKGYYTAKGVRDDADFLDNIKRNINLSGVVIGVAPRYGIIVHYTAQRVLPTLEGLYAQKDDFNFDQLQNSALDVGTPVAVVHTSTDGAWVYVISAISDGWVKAEDIALGDSAQVKEFAQDQDFVVVIKPKADIFLNEGMTDYYDYVRMGVRLPLASIDAGHAAINLPVRNTDGTLTIQQAYMNAEDVVTGFLPLTARNIYKQALMMLNQPYGWGDKDGEQDCSRFVQMVFATMGVILPRDSKDQAQVSDQVVDFDEKDKDAAKLAAILKAPAANTLLAMKGHILLYLGSIDGVPYAIHDTTGYKKVINNKEVTVAIDRVIISDLSLGQGSKKSSLLRRLMRTVSIQ